MRKLIALALATGAFSTPALAETFSGPYIGAEIGRDAYEVKAEDLAISSVDFSADGLSGNGLMGGAYIGYDYALSGSIFAGVEAFINTSGAKISASATDGVDTVSASVKARESYGLAARLGTMINDSTGIYARLGWARTKFKASYDDGVDVLSDSRTRSAFQYGAGVETRVGSNASIRVEYTMQDYGSAGLDADFGVTGIKVNSDQVRLGVGYRF